MNSCKHSILKCGECRAEEKELNNGKVNLAAIESRVEEYRAGLLKEHWSSHPGPVNQPQWGGTVTPAPPPAAEPAKPVKLDLGCGKNKKEGFIGVDCLDFPGVDVKLDIGKDRWPWADSSVDEVHCAHTVEHLQFNPEYPERIRFANELWRVLKSQAKATIVVPHWASCRQYGDYTHREPVCEMWPWYLNKAWRASDAPHNNLYTCDFDCTTPGYSWHTALNHRNDEYRQFAMHWYKEAAQDMIFTLVARK